MTPKRRQKMKEQAWEIVRSKQNRTVIEIGKLTDRRERESKKCFRFDGIKLLVEALSNRLELTHILLRESTADALTDAVFSKFGKDAFASVGRILLLSDDVFAKLSEEKSPEGVICVAKYIDKLQKNVTIYNSEEFLTDRKERIVFLESVRDPSNIGAIIRSAAALGVDRLIVSADCADIYHPRAVRASMGTIFNQRIDRTEELTGAIRALLASGRHVYAAALDETARRLGDFQIEVGDCVVIGNEGHGLSEQVLNVCDHRVYIPMSDRAESFNAAVAASILMWEFMH